MSAYVNVINTSPFSSAALPAGVANPGVCVVWANTGTQLNTSGASSVSVQTNYLCQSSQTLMLDGYSSSGTLSGGCYTFKGVVNFTLGNPIYTDDENDVILMYIVFPEIPANALSGPTIVNYNNNTSFNITCSLSNLGSMVTTPIYQATSTSVSSATAGGYVYITIPINKWFAFRAPGSIYRLSIEGYTNINCSAPSSTGTNTCLCNSST